MTAATLPATLPATGHGLLIGDTEDLRLSAVRAPYLSVLAWLVSAGAPTGARTAFASAVATAAPPSSVRVAAALGTPGLARLPEYLVPLAPSHDATVTDNVVALRAAPVEDLAAELSTWATPLGAPWRAAADHPDRWRDDFARAADAAWDVGRRRWQDGRHPIDREVARIGTAVVTGGVPALLNSLHPRLRYRDGVLWFRGRASSSVPLAGRRLVLAPILAPAHRVMVSFERPDVAYIAYPVLGPTAPLGARVEDRLELVVGQLRAAALRRLAQPSTMQALAAEIHCAASTATYHCDLLDAAGLVVRERRGSAVWVMRTPAGDALVDLLS